LIVKLNSLKEITVNSRDIFEELDIEDLIRTVSMVIALYNRYYSDYKSDKPEYKNKFTHNSIYELRRFLCIINALMSEEYERIGIDTAKSMPEPTILEHKQ
jgi:putative NADH-flavin reductase